MSVVLKKAITGKAHVYGDHIDTDTIISAKYINKVALDQLHKFALESLDANFSNKVSKGDILVGGKNFGCGSSREVAPMVLRDAGISVVIAASFARIFFRNAINIGLPVLAIGHHEIHDGQIVEVDLTQSLVKLESTDKIYRGNRLPPIVLEIIKEGGLLNYMTKHKDFKIPIS